MLSDLILRLRALFKRSVVEDEIDEELRFHLERQVESYRRDGLDHAAAVRRARAEFGGLDQVKEEYRDALGVRIVDELGRDLRLALRSLRATPVVTSVAVLSLTLGIGGNTAIFSIVNSLLLRALPVQDPQSLAILEEDGQVGSSWTNPLWEDIRGRAGLFAGALAWSTVRFDLSEGGEAQLVEGIWASGSFFDVLGVHPLIGRMLTPEDDRRSGGSAGLVAVISHRFWMQRFNGGVDAVGRQMTLNRVPFTIVGVTPPGFFGPDVGRAFDVIVPLGTEPAIRGSDSWLDERWSWWLNIVVRLKPGQTIDAANAALVSVLPAIRHATLPPSMVPGDLDSYLSRPISLAPAATGRSPLRSRYQHALLTILAVVGLVLLVACANIANLLLARATARRHELSVHLALGAPRWRLARQWLIESLVLACAGAACGALFAQWAGHAIVAQLSTQANLVFLDLTPDWRVLGFAVGLTVLTAAVFGTAPALRASRVALMASIKEGGRTLTDGRGGGTADGLIVAQVALSVMLVVLAGLFVRTFAFLANVPLGVDVDRLLLVEVSASKTMFRETDLAPLFDRARAAAAAVPGVERASMSTMEPVTGGQVWNTRVNVEGAPALPARQRTTNLNATTPGWFATVGTPLLVGRDFNADDRAGAPLVAIVNEAFAGRFGLGTNPVGGVILFREPGATHEVHVRIVALARDAVYRVPRDPIPPTMYVPLAQQLRTQSRISLSVRARAGSPAALAQSIEAAMAGVSPDVSLTFRPMKEQVDGTLLQERLLATLAGFFGLLALLLAGLGLYGITAYAVSRRRNEIGIRMALGAAPGGVIRLVLARVCVLVSLGLAIGTAGSMWATRFVATLLYGLEPHDPATLIGSAMLLAGVAALAGWLPARRAARIDPVAVLRKS